MNETPAPFCVPKVSKSVKLCIKIEIVQLTELKFISNHSKAINPLMASF